LTHSSSWAMPNSYRTYTVRNQSISNCAIGARNGVHAAENRPRAGARTGAAT